MNVGINNRASTINQIFVGVNNIARLVYQSGGGTPAFQLPEFTGNNAISGDELSGRIELYESGTLTLYPGTYDFFLVGGGGAGNTGGGGGGYTQTYKSLQVSDLTRADVIVGSTSGTTSVNHSNLTPSSLEVNGGKTANTYDGGSGGSGGGGYGGHRGGSDGGNGQGDTYVGGTGQGTTTRAFGEAGGTLYAGGGGGGSGGNSSNGSGGSGGGGRGGGTSSSGVSGTINTGGGGGGDYQARVPGQGGSGIIIVRWNNT